MLFKPRIVNETYVQEQYLENIGNKKGQPSGSKQKDHQVASKEGKKKWKGKEKKTISTAHKSTDPKNHCNHCNINGHTKDKCWKLHPNLNPKSCKKDSKKKNLLSKDSSNQIESNSNVDENVVFTIMQNEVNLSSLDRKEEKGMTKLFHISIQVNKIKVVSLFDSGSQVNLIKIDIVNKLGLEVHDHPNPHPLGCVNKDVELKVIKQCKIKLTISANYIDEVEVDVVPLDACSVVFGSPYMYLRDVILMWKAD